MQNQNTKLFAHGAEIQITPAGSVYVTINGTTVYFENGSVGLYLTLWTEDMEPDTAIDLVECMEAFDNSEVK
jgi:hypothetical protein